MYTLFTVGNRDYKLCMNLDGIIAFEKKTGINPVGIYGMDEDNPKMPTVTTMIAVLWASMLKFEHGVSFENAKNIFKAWLDEGHTPMEFLSVITKIYEVSGIYSKDESNDEDSVEKN